MIDILIIGGGAAGMNAALYAKRSGKNCLILERESFGGQIATSPKVENFPGFKEISGLELSEKMFEQISNLDVEFDCDEVVKLEKKGDIFNVTTLYNQYEAKTVIIATGVKHRHLNAIGEDFLIGKGVSYCAMCDGAFFKDKKVAVIGDANTALQYALMLADLCSHVDLCMLFDRFFADDVLVQRVLANPKITVTKEISLNKFIGTNTLEGLEFTNTKTNEIVTFAVEGCFVAIGQIPDNDIYKDLCDLDQNGYIISDDTTTKTEGLWVAGDCRTKKIRQLVTAVADGAEAAVNAVNYLNKKNM